MATQSVKDILDTEIPKPVWTLRPTRATPVPSDIGQFERSSKARGFNPSSVQWEEVAVDEPRTYGGNQGLIVSSLKHENLIKQSSDIFDWNQTGASVDTNRTSIIDGSKSTGRQISGNNSYDRYAISAGQTTTGESIYYTIIEPRSSTKIGMSVGNSNTGNEILVSYDINDDSFNTVRENSGTVVDRSAATLRDIGPNGSGNNPLILVALKFKQDSGGDGQFVEFHPDFNGNGDSVIFHHGQADDLPVTGFPVVTKGSTRKIEPERAFVYNGGQPSWWNSNEMTYVIDFATFHANYATSAFVMANGGSNRFLNVFDGGLSVVDSGDNSLSLGSAPGFERTRVAVSLTQSGMTGVSSADNSSIVSTNHSGSLLEQNQIRIGGASATQIVYEISFMPKAVSNTALKALVA
jgi:hypothetical protein